MTSELKKITTGVPGLDIISNGGIPEGRSTLVVGRAGRGRRSWACRSRPT